MKILTATVVNPPREVATKYGQRRVLDIRLSDGSETAIWGPLDYAPLEYLEQGQSVTVSRDSKGKVSIIENHDVYRGMDSNPEPPAGQLSPEQKREIAQYITQQRDLLAFCLDQASTIDQAQTDDSVQKLGVTLYIAAQRKFKL